MKAFHAVAVAASFSYLVSTAFAADAPKPAAPAAPTSAKVDMTAVDLQVALIAIANAGSACDIGVKQYCQLLPLRDTTTAKLQAAFNDLNGIVSTPASPK